MTGKILVSWTTWLHAIVASATIASAVEPLDFFEVVKVRPPRVITHDVSLKSRFDNELDVESSVWLCVPAEIAADTIRARK